MKYTAALYQNVWINYYDNWYKIKKAQTELICAFLGILKCLFGN